MVDSLCAARFVGQLDPPGGEPVDLAYRFHDAPMAQPLPLAVKLQRQNMRWTLRDVRCVGATCSIPALGLTAEEVVVSVDPGPEADGSTRILLQSIQRPDLGVTVLYLAANGSELVGGEEDWTPSDQPLIRASRAAASAVASPRSPAASSQRSPLEAPGRPARVARETRNGVVAAAETASEPLLVPQLYHDPDSDPEHAQEAKDAVARPQRGYVEGGVGQSGMAIDRCEAAAARRRAGLGGGGGDRGGGYSGGDESYLRPDAAAGAPGAPLSSGVSAEPGAVAAEAAERLVAAAALGETGDVRRLLARVGPNRPALAGGRHAGLTPFMAACERGREDVVELLLEARADLEVFNEDGCTALMLAVRGQRSAVVRRIIAARADVRVAEREDGLTALMMAAAGARPELCSALLGARAPLEARDKEGRRAVHHAARGGRGGALVAILGARANVEAIDGEGRTALLQAAASGRAECAWMLLTARANLEATDTGGRSALRLAEAYGHERARDVLKEFAAELPGARLARRIAAAEQR